MQKNLNPIYDLIRADGSIVLNKNLCHAIGVNETIAYSELLSRYNYFSIREELDEEGYFFNTVDDLELGTSLSAKQQKMALTNLQKIGLIKTKLKGIPAKRHIAITDDITLLLSLIEKGRKTIGMLEEKQLINRKNQKIRREKAKQTQETQLISQKGVSRTDKTEELDTPKGSVNNTNIIILNNNTKEEEEETFWEIINLYSSIKDSKINSYDRKILLEQFKIYGGLITLEAIKTMAEKADKPNLSYLKKTLEDWSNKGLDTIEKIELHFAKEEVLKEDAKKNNHLKLERAAKGQTKVKQDSFNSYDQRPRTAEELEEIAKATRGNEEVEEVKDTKEWLERMRNKKER